MARNGALFSTLHMVARAAVWKSTPRPVPAGLSLLILCSSSTVVTSSAYEYVAAGANARFALYGVNAHLAALLVTMVVAALFVRQDGRSTFLSAMMLLASAIGLLWLCAAQAHWISPYDTAKPMSAAGYAVFVLSLIWWGGAVLALLRSVEPERRFKLPRTVGLWLSLLLVNAALPYEPLFHGRAFDHRLANVWEYVAAYRDGSFARDAAPKPRTVDRAQVELAQPALMDAQISHLAPQVKGQVNIYAVGVAGFSDQRVFVNELDGGLKSLSRVFPLDGHIVRLVNYPDTITTLPAATRQNFAAAIHDIARVMNKNEDVLLVFLTSHGSQDGLALLLRGAYYADLSPSDLAAVLDREGIRNRMIIVSACYSGVFLMPLLNDRTIVISAADATHTSFGCSDKREWTYFGDAFFNRSLGPGETVEDAFAKAKATIARWESRDSLPPSNPQGHFGPDLMTKLAPVYLSARTANARAPATLH